MKKKAISLVLVAALVMSLLSACGKKEPEATPTPTQAPTPTATTAPTPTNAPEAEKLPDAFAHITFDGQDEGYKTVINVDELGTLTGANKGIAVTDKAPVAYTNGPVGQCIYLDGSFGLDLGLKATNTDAWTVSYWMNAARLSDYGATLQIGYNMGMAADAGNNVTWMNITQTNFDPKYFPTIWSRNEASDKTDGSDCWPWMAAFQDGGSVVGKKEWILITVVCSGEEQISPVNNADGVGKTVGAQLYINGNLMYDSQDNYKNNTYFEYGWDATLAPNIMKPDDSTFESLFGINYWDTIYKGYVDDLYVFDKALTAGQIQTLFQMGDVNVDTKTPETQAPDVTEAPEPTPIDHTNVVTTGTVVGATDCTTPFWTQFSPIWAVAAGETKSVTLKTFTDGMANWHAPAFILQNTATGHAAADAEGYKEYGVVRMDNWGWNATADTGNLAALGWELACDWNWDTMKTAIDNATVTVSVTNNTTTADVVLKIVTADGDEFNQSYKNIAIDGDLYFCFTVEAAFAEILSHDDAAVTGTLVGTLDCATPFWTAFSDIWEVPANGSKTVKFVNYSSRVNNWNNFAAILQNTATGHAAADAEGYKEYAVVRADNWGWNATADTGNLAALGWELACDWNWDTFKADLDNSTVELTATNNGTTVEVVAVVTTSYGKTYTQSYKNIAVDGPVYLTLTVDGAAIDIQ